MQIVKADAYGHGALQIANQAIKEGATILGFTKCRGSKPTEIS